jgi:hypothetical protein
MKNGVDVSDNVQKIKKCAIDFFGPLVFDLFCSELQVRLFSIFNSIIFSEAYVLIS